MTIRSESRSWRLGELLLAGVCYALVTGLLHVAITWVRRYVLHEFTWTSREIIWMAPLGYLGFFLPVAVVLAVVGRVWRPVSPYAGTLVNAFLMVLAILLLYPGINQWASIVLAAGAAVQLARLATRRPVAWRRTLAIAAPTLAAAIVITSVALHARRSAVERRMMAEYPAAPSDAPNVLLIILDTVRAASVSFYGYARETMPHLAELAKSATTFDYAFSTAPWSLPSHGSIMTGRPAVELTAGFLAPLDTAELTLAEVLRAKGYATGGFVANSYYTHTESGIEQGFAHYEDYANTPEQVLFSTTYGQSKLVRDLYKDGVRGRSPMKALRAIGRFQLSSGTRYTPANRKQAATVDGQFLRWQEGLGQRPFFAFLNLFDAHDYAPTPAFAHKFSKNPTSRDNYDAAIASMDQAVDEMLRTLEKRGVLDRTIVIITADHGEQIGEHGQEGHDSGMYTQLLHVPLVIRYPGAVPAGVRVTQVASLQDIPATVLDLVRPHVTASLPGTSLRTLWSVPPVDPARRAGSYYHNVALTTHRETTQFSVVDDSLHFIREILRLGPAEPAVNGQRELVTERMYRYREDTAEEKDLRSTDIGVALADQYRALLPKAGPARPEVRAVMRSR